VIALRSASKDCFKPSWLKQPGEAHSQQGTAKAQWDSMYSHLLGWSGGDWHRPRFSPRARAEGKAQPGNETAYGSLAELPGSRKAKKVAKYCHFCLKMDKGKGHKEDISHKNSELKQQSLNQVDSNGGCN